MANTLRPASAQNQQDASSGFLKEKFDTFLNSLVGVLNDITALEVNTMVVTQITGEKFIPNQAYRDIYTLTDECLQKQHIPTQSFDRYKSLRKQLESAYRAIVNQPEAVLPDPELVNLDMLLDQGDFLRTLRKLAEIKGSLDSDDPTSPRIDIIYAQTVLQLDGDVINRYDERLLRHEQKDLLLNIHTQGVASGEQQWHGILLFMVDMAKGVLTKQGGSGSLFPWNGQKQDG